MDQTPPKSRIKLLPDHLINRIAAGEVIERPASILKELLDNSLDAGADRIEIEIRAGGRRLIRVRDNGRGMNREDLLMCLERHATSKLDQHSDLLAINTLGFRGEALPSIASVSRLSVTSCEPGGQGLNVQINGGRLDGLSPSPANPGTTVAVTDLFFNVPARRKFLKSDQTEAAHLLETAQRYALSRDNLRLSYHDESGERLTVDRAHDFRTRAARILGRTAAQNLAEVSFEAEDLSIQGWIDRSDRSFRTSANLYMYVLGRPVRDRLLARALAQGYGRLLPPGRWPTAIIQVDLDPREVDVNVHPAKAEVRFRQPDRVFAALSQTVARAVGQTPLASDFPSSENRFRPAPPPDRPAAPSRHVQPPNGAANLNRTLRAAVDVPKTPPWLWEAGAEALPPDPETAVNLERLRSAGAEPPVAFLPERFPRGERTEELPDTAVRPLAQLHQSYILAQGPEGLYVIDQHAAHERILFNRLRDKLLREGLPGQALLFPETADLTPHQALAAEKLAPALERLGFDLAPFGGPTYILKSAPAILGSRDSWPILLEILTAAQGRLKSLDGAGTDQVLEDLAETWVYSLACRAAIKAGDTMTIEQMSSLLNDLRQSKNGASCPHGRPSVYRLTLQDLARKFHRV